MNFRQHLFTLVFLLCASALVAQTELVLEPGLGHLRILDRHASPLVYQTTNPQLGLRLLKIKNKRLLDVRVSYMNGQLEPADADLSRYEFKGDKNTNTFALAASRLWQHQRDSSVWWGVSAGYNVYIDFVGIANFPWATLYGDVGLTLRKDFAIGEKICLSATVGLPLLGVVTRQPYNFIPRIEGEEPGVSSLLTLGTEVVTWNSYQRTDLSLSGKVKLGQRWTLRPTYRFHWARYTEPKVIRLYRQELVASLSYKF